MDMLVSERPAARETAIHGDGPLILIIEDDPRAEALLRHTLEPSGFRVEAARNGEEALVKVKALGPAAITLDVILPGIDGWGVLQVLKSDPETRDVPVVVLTIVDDPSTAYALGASDFFLKPVDRKLLLERLSRYTGQPNGPGSTLTVLVVDDDANALTLLDESL
ncbi:Response regulator receiver protein, partial [mine drainage metagenome]